MKFTKGNWYVREVRAYKNELVYTRIDSDNKTLGFAGVYCDDKRKISINEAKANAKLIAAAPDLLEFAIEMVKRYPNSEWIYKQGNAAIRKATK